MMAEKCLLTILEISIASAPVMLLLLLVAPVLGKRYGSKLRCLVWLAVAVRLIIPLNAPFENAISINLFSAMGTQAEEVGWFLPNPAQIIERETEANEQDAASEQAAARYKPIRITAVMLAAIVWAAGVTLFLLYHLAAYFYTLHKLRRWSAPIQDAEILHRFASVQKELSMQSGIRLCQSSKAASPLLVGFVHPRIILPEQTPTQEQLDFMLRHELWHLKRGDLWFKLVMLLANAIHWFNPLVWIMSRQADLDTELACDTDVLRGANGNERKAYGYTVLCFMQRGWQCKTPLTSRFYGGKTQMKQRFYNIADTSNKKRGTALFCAVALVIALAGCAVHAAAPEQSTPKEVEAETPASTVENTASPQPEIPAALVMEDMDEVNAIFEIMEWAREPYSGGEMAWPAPGFSMIKSQYGWRNEVADFHTGIDIGGAEIFGAAIIAASDGTVIYVNKEWKPGVGYGMYVILDHGGETSTLYGHCSKILVSVGQSVVKGEKIAEAGATGFASEPHLHFEVRKAGVAENPIPYITSTGFIWPTTGGYTSLGVGAFPGHTGMDIAGLPYGSPVYAAAAGTVSVAEKREAGYGEYIIVDHGNGFETYYAHNSALYVNEGDVVAQGQVIAAVGSSGDTTGTHLHFEIRHGGRIYNPEDFVGAPSAVEAD